MLTLEEARALVVDAISQPARPDNPFGLDDGLTIEKPWGWVFFYNSQRYLETRDDQYQLFGNAPFIVNKLTGEIRGTGTAKPIEFYISEYEATLDWCD